MSCAGVPGTVVQVIDTTKSLTRSDFASFRCRARGIEGASLSERRQEQHLRKKREILARADLLRSGIATSGSQVTFLTIAETRN